MNGGDIFLLALGPTIALASGLIIYALGLYGPEHTRQTRELVQGVLDRLDTPAKK